LKKLKLFNDPIYGFITIKNPLIFKIIEHPYFQRLRRISQMGLSYLVYPGAHHTRFHHVIGCTFLMQKAIEILRMKEVEISEEEEEALLVAILLHDLGHGPFSHALEGCFVQGLGHEEISMKFMMNLNEEMKGRLDLAIQIFRGEYPRSFMNQLISGQLDMDRLDYLKRDSFCSGVAEGNLNSERLISMLCVQDDQLAVQEKGIYSVEKFILARRFMYWQVYLHKTGLAAENILIKVVRRVRELKDKGIEVPMSPVLRTFMENRIGIREFDDSTLEIYSRLDDSDVLQGMKSWCDHEDFILAYLSRSIIHRRLPRIEMADRPFTKTRIEQIRQNVKSKFGIQDGDIDYLVYSGEVSNMAYKTEPSGILIAFKNGTTKDILEASGNFGIAGLDKKMTRYFLCYPKKHS
jgi:HD superfamily phosphohydrolase